MSLGWMLSGGRIKPCIWPSALEKTGLSVPEILKKS
jgi:hypothetical protein